MLAAATEMAGVTGKFFVRGRERRSVRISYGSSGGTGRELVRQGLAAGHEVTAFARSAAAITEEHRALRVVEGSVTDPIAVATAITGQEAVLI